MRVEYSNPYLKVLSSRNPNGEDYTFVKEADKAVVLPYYYVGSELKILTLIEPISLWNRKKEVTCITGTIEAGEDPNDCAVRELKEEGGLYCPWDLEKWNFVGAFNFNKSCTAKRYLFLVDFTGEEIAGRPTDGSWFEKHTKVCLSDIKVAKVSTDIYLHFLIEKLQNKLEQSNNY